MLNVYVCVYGSRYVYIDLYPLYSVSYFSADHVLVPRAGTSFVQRFAWSAKRGQMCLVCLPLAQFAWVSRALNILARVGASFVQGKCA